METANLLFTFVVTYTDSMNIKMILDILILDTYICVLRGGTLCQFIHSTPLRINLTVTMAGQRPFDTVCYTLCTILVEICWDQWNFNQSRPTDYLQYVACIWILFLSNQLCSSPSDLVSCDLGVTCHWGKDVINCILIWFYEIYYLGQCWNICMLHVNSCL